MGRKAQGSKQKVEITNLECRPWPFSLPPRLSQAGDQKTERGSGFCLVAPKEYL